MTTTLPIDQMIDTGRGTISRDIFVSPEFYQEELEKLFTRAWLFVGHESQIQIRVISSCPAWARNRSSCVGTPGARCTCSSTPAGIAG